MEYVCTVNNEQGDGRGIRRDLKKQKEAGEKMIDGIPNSTEERKEEIGEKGGKERDKKRTFMR